MKRYASILLVALVFVALDKLQSQTLDVEQPLFTVTHDLILGGVSGQTFTATVTAKLYGIRLWVDGQKWSGNYPFGSAFTVNLRKVVGGKVQDGIVASGTVTKDHLQLGVAVLTDVYFTVPYNQTAGEALAFTVQEHSGGGMNGWNEFAMTSTNPYAGGTQFYRFDSSTVLPTTPIDLAFATITRPPAIVAEEKIRTSHSDATGEYTIELLESRSGRSYVIEESTDMTTWQPGTTKMGTGGLLRWVINPGVPRAFYRVKVQY